MPTPTITIRPVDATPNSNLENTLYAAWQKADDREKTLIESKMFSVLRAHASKVCWMVLHDRRPDFVDEIVEDTLTDLASFQGNSKFSTWFHSRAFHRLNDERRKRLSSREVPLSPADSPIVENDSDQRILVQQMMAKLSERDRQIVYMRFFEGRTAQEIADRLGVDRRYVERSWASRIKQQLRSSYGGRE